MRMEVFKYLVTLNLWTLTFYITSGVNAGSYFCCWPRKHDTKKAEEKFFQTATCCPLTCIRRVKQKVVNDFDCDLTEDYVQNLCNKIMQISKYHKDYHHLPSRNRSTPAKNNLCETYKVLVDLFCVFIEVKAYKCNTYPDLYVLKRKNENIIFVLKSLYKGCEALRFDYFMSLDSGTRLLDFIPKIKP